MTLIRDNLKHTKISTFLDNEKILLQIGSRYMLFNQNGSYIDDANFDDIETARTAKLKKQRQSIIEYDKNAASGGKRAMTIAPNRQLNKRE